MAFSTATQLWKALAQSNDENSSNRRARFDPTVTAVIIGETGSGKSSLISLFHFWACESRGEQPRFEDAHRQSIIRKENEAGGSQSGSQTLKPYLYKFFLKFDSRGYNFLLLDTPGMGDIQGLKQDDENITRILEFVEKTASVNAVMLMLNGSNCRVSSRTQYILQRLYGMCPKTFENNLYLILSNTQLEPNFDFLKDVKLKFDPEHVIPIDNLLFSPGGSKYATSSHFQRKKIEANYTENKEILSYLFQQLLKGGALRPDAYRDLRINRDKQCVKVSGILKAITDSNDIQDQINKEMSELTKNVKPTLELLRQKANMTTETVKITQRDTPYHNTQCLTCASICHENCNLTYTAVVGDNIFQGCACMNNNICKDCRHDYTTHVHVKFIFERQSIKVPLFTNDDRRKLDTTTSIEQQKQMIIQKLMDRLTQNMNQVLGLKNELQAALKQLKTLCPHYDYKMELRCAIKLLEEEELVGEKEHNPAELKALKKFFEDLIDQFDKAQAS